MATRSLAYAVFTPSEAYDSSMNGDMFATRMNASSSWFAIYLAGGQRKIRARRPARMNKAAAPTRTGPERATPRYFLLAHAVTGQAARPENIANQPWVGGHGPVVMMRPSPPHPARMNHAQAAMAPMSAAHLPQLNGLFSGLAPG